MALVQPSNKIALLSAKSSSDGATSSIPIENPRCPPKKRKQRREKRSIAYKSKKIIPIVKDIPLSDKV